MKLFEPIQIKNLSLKNRIVMAPMCMYCAPETGMVTNWHRLQIGRASCRERVSLVV